MNTKYKNLLEKVCASSITKIFEAEAAETEGAATEENAGSAEFTPTEEQILSALMQKIGPEQFLAKVTKLATPEPAAAPEATPAAPAATPAPAAPAAPAATPAA